MTFASACIVVLPFVLSINWDARRGGSVGMWCQEWWNICPLGLRSGAEGNYVSVICFGCKLTSTGDGVAGGDIVEKRFISGADGVCVGKGVPWWWTCAVAKRVVWSWAGKPAALENGMRLAVVVGVWYGSMPESILVAIVPCLAFYIRGLWCLLWSGGVYLARYSDGGILDMCHVFGVCGCQLQTCYWLLGCVYGCWWGGMCGPFVRLSGLSQYKDSILPV